MTVLWAALATSSVMDAADFGGGALRIFLYDYTGLDRGLAQRSIEIASRALWHAGLETNWQRCGVPQRPREGGCQGRADSMVIQMRLQEREHGKKLGRRFYEFGYAVAPERGLGVVAGVYVDRARMLSREQGYGLALILGHAMAHEIGHLLLGVQSHSRSGLMTRVWKERELRLASTGLLRFTQAQSLRMRQQISVRSGRTDASRVQNDFGHDQVRNSPNHQAGNLPLSPIPFRLWSRLGRPQQSFDGREVGEAPFTKVLDRQSCTRLRRSG